MHEHVQSVSAKINCQRRAKLCSKILNPDLSQVAGNMRVYAQSSTPPTRPTKDKPQQYAKRCSKLLTSSPSYQKSVISNVRSYGQRYSTSTCPTKTKSSTTCESMCKAHHLQPVPQKIDRQQNASRCSKPSTSNPSHKKQGPNNTYASLGSKRSTSNPSHQR